MEDAQTVNYALALKIYQQKGFGRSMKKMRTQTQECPTRRGLNPLSPLLSDGLLSQKVKEIKNNNNHENH